MFYNENAWAIPYLVSNVEYKTEFLAKDQSEDVQKGSTWVSMWLLKREQSKAAKERNIN